MQKEAGGGNGDVSNLLHSEFDPWHVNGSNGRAAWGKSNDGRDNYGPNVCWDKQGSNEPLGLQPLTDEEKLVCSSSLLPLVYSVNSFRFLPATSILLLSHHLRMPTRMRMRKA